MNAFMSYQTADRHIAAEIRDYLDSIEIEAFMAHKDIDASHEWQTEILGALDQALVEGIITAGADFVTGRQGSVRLYVRTS